MVASEAFERVATRRRRRRIFGPLTWAALVLATVELIGLSLLPHWESIGAWFEDQRLLHQLGDRNAEVRDVASIALRGRISRAETSEGSLAALRRVRQSGSPRARLHAAAILQDWEWSKDRAENADAALDALAGDDIRTLSLAAATLIQMREVDDLSWQGQFGDPELPRVAARLRRIVDSAGNALLRESAEDALLSWYDGIDPATIDLHSRLSDPDPAVRLRVARGLVLADEATAEAGELLLDLYVTTADPQVEGQAGTALFGLSPRASAGLFNRLLGRLWVLDPVRRVQVLSLLSTWSQHDADRSEVFTRVLLVLTFLDPERSPWYDSVRQRALGEQAARWSPGLGVMLAWHALRPAIIPASHKVGGYWVKRFEAPSILGRQRAPRWIAQVLHLAFPRRFPPS